MKMNRSPRCGGRGLARAFGFLLAGALVTATPLFAQIKILRVDPQETSHGIAAVHGPHLAIYDPQAPAVHRLFVFLPGTGGRAEGGRGIASAFAGWGYHAISLDYEDNVVAVTCAHSTNAKCFDNYRDAIVTGAAVSKKIQVDRANSILNRLQKLLVYLVKHDPAGGWQEFVKHGKPEWSRIDVAGISQGAGHAAYIGKLFALDRVLILSGPQDYLDNLDRSAPWLARPSATPDSHYFAFLNLHDPFNVHHQIANCMVLMGFSNPETQVVKAGEPIWGTHQILVTDFVTARPHGSTLLPRFANVWEYMGGGKRAEACSPAGSVAAAPRHPRH